MQSYTFKQQLKSLADTLVNTVKNGQALVDEKTLDKRLAECQKCDQFIERNTETPGKTATCKICKCKLKRKLIVSGSSCPLGKW